MINPSDYILQPANPGFFVVTWQDKATAEEVLAWAEPIISWAIDSENNVLPVVPAHGIWDYLKGDNALLYPCGKVDEVESARLSLAEWVNDKQALHDALEAAKAARTAKAAQQSTTGKGGL